MPLDTFDFTTGPATLPDAGELSYNGCVFSPLFETSVSGNAVKDDAQRTVKYMEYTIKADGYVTLPDGNSSIAPTMVRLRELLTAQGGHLTYMGRGCDIVVNPPGRLPNTTRQRDVAWGPVPELLEFQPMGGGRSAKVVWQVKTRIPEINGATFFFGSGLASTPLLQFNYDTVVSYPEDGFSSLTVNGTMEIPLTRNPSQRSRALIFTVDNVRRIIEDRVMRGVDLNEFRITRREFNVSRDKRTMQWSFAAEEKPYMDLPPDCTIARGSYNVRPARAGMGLVLWLCTLRATYTVRNDRPRRTAWVMFLAMLRLRMSRSALSYISSMDNTAIHHGPRPIRPTTAGTDALREVNRLIEIRQALEHNIIPTSRSRRAWLIELSFDEGLYLDSKTTSFSATWRLVTEFSHIMLASGLWTKLQEGATPTSEGYWATTMRGISGARSWKGNVINPRLDVIVDFGGYGATP